MKSLLALLAVLALLPMAARAQQTQSPEAQSQNPTAAAAAPRPASSPELSGSEAASTVPLPGQSVPASQSLEKPLPLMPETMPPGAAEPAGRHRKGAEGQAGGAAGTSGTESKNTFDVEQDIRGRIHIRIAETQAENESRIQADWLAAHETRTDPARRAALTKYYTDLAAEIEKIDPTIIQQAESRKEAAIDRLHYAHLGDEPPDFDPYGTPAPAGESQNPPSQDTINGY
jgi:hypothetical protein